jgi:hypothetical protein
LSFFDVFASLHLLLLYIGMTMLIAHDDDNGDELNFDILKFDRKLECSTCTHYLRLLLALCPERDPIFRGLIPDGVGSTVGV